MLDRLRVLSTTHMIVERFLYLTLAPTLIFATRGVDLLISPLHELIAVIGLGTKLPDELVALLSGLLINRDFLFELRLDEPVT